ncbi:hypothetical protein [Amycolatopsis alkalitolerans]|uniref:Phosphate transport regulator n=1 Tax=Amycolatopsis alkalitolerans TaxID=2547244 RepID=A0A5C4LSC0_9PSEU|nr:hypothetical protein [Amycolatopsis alkalitolerans]TNC19381.1 hypothetical protein FG385_32345 [Amycolatopsis alkalitolerans]
MTALATKTEIVEELGESTLLLPFLVNRGLVANERAKYLLSLLQAARTRADHPAEPFAVLRTERLAAGVRDPRYDEVVAKTERASDGRYLIPGAGRIHEELFAAIREMLAPLAAADVTAPDASRLAALAAAAPDLTGDLLAGEYVDGITSTRRQDGDSPHLLVMDAHRALNQLQALIATESVDGAACYQLGDGDRELVAAFVAGVHETEALKFDHPGLATTATRAGDRLVIQNELGTTNAHVVLLAVEGLVATLTYTDVHARRLRFFESMLAGYDIAWSDVQRRQGGATLGEHHVAVGRFVATDTAALAAYLRRVGSRLVFVLDWNRARKRLTPLLGRDDAIAVLSWAAEENAGHLAWLSLGGERLIYDAVEAAVTVPARYGEPLVEVLGREATVAITKFALRAAALGRLAGKSTRLIHDEVRVEVRRHVQASHRRLLDTSAEHASLIVECAQALHAALLRLGAPGGVDYLRRAAGRAAGWEHQADQFVLVQRRDARRVEGGATVAQLTTSADDAIDSLEEAVFQLTLVPPGAIGAVRPLLERVAAVTVRAAREHLKAVELARSVVDDAEPEDLEDFLLAIERVGTLEHAADSADRSTRAALVTDAPEFRSLYVADGVSRAMEEATDALLRSALRLRDHILGLVASR